jgi:transposase
MGKPVTDLPSVATVGLDLASTCFKSTASMFRGALWSPRRSGVTSSWSFSPRCRRALLALRPALRAHHWARELIKLGHRARMMPPAYVKPYVRRQKNDAADAAGICEAVTRPSMRFVGLRSRENQAALMRHMTREMLVSQRTQWRCHVAKIRAHLLPEFIPRAILC